MSDRRADARDSRLTDHDSTAPTGRDESKKVGRVTLDEIDWGSAAGRRVPYEVWMDHAATPFPSGRHERWDDWPDVPTRIEGWRFRSGTTSNGYLTPGYLDADADGQYRRNLHDADAYVEFTDKRTFGKGIQAHVVTPNVKVAPGATPNPPIVTADDPEAFVKRIVAHLDGIPPEEITHPRYDPSLERNLPENWEFNRLLPLQSKTTFTWSGEMIDGGSMVAWAVEATGWPEGNNAMTVYAYPIPSLGEKSPKVFPDDVGIDVMPGPGTGPAAETARRLMRWLNENPDEMRPKGTGTETPDDNVARDTLSFTDPDGENVEFFVGDEVRTVYTHSQTGDTEVLGGVLSGWQYAEPDRTSTDDRGPLVIDVDGRDDYGADYIVKGRDVIVDRKVGKLLPGKLPIYLTRRGG